MTELENKMIGDDLIKLAEILDEYRLINDVSPLQRAGAICRKKATDIEWTYNLAELCFGITPMGSIIPHGADDIIINLSIDISGESPLDISEKSLSDPLKDLQFNLEIFGYCLDREGKDIDLYSAWHFDKHIFEEGNNPTAYSHPEYHATFGGRKMEESIYDYGQTIILPAPRFAYPPMDAVLGIDFILQNYFPLERIKKLLEDPKYKQIVGKSKDRIWKPYFYSIYSHWEVKPIKIEGRYQPHHLFPLLG